MRRPAHLRSLALLALPFLAACSSAPIVGTWTGRGDASQPFTFGSVSFVGDKTFTAEARYGNTTRVQSGRWSTHGDTLELASTDGTRDYRFGVRHNELTVTDPKTGRSMILDRFSGR